MASMACYQFTVVDEAGNVRPSASVRVDIEGGGLATLYSDRSAATPLGNPFTADAQGFAQFFLSGGAYKITATYGGASRVWRYVPISRAAEMLPATDGYIPFANDNGLSTDSALFWDNTNKRLGIGTTSPTVKADIVGNAVIGTGTRSEGNVRCLTLQGATAYGQLSIISTVTDGEASYACKATNISNGAAGHWLFGSSIAATNKFSIGNGGSWGQFVIDTSGNVGIGTTSPGAKFHTKGADGSLVALFSGTTKGLRVITTSSYTALEGVDHTGSASYQPIVFSGSIVQFAIAGTEYMRLDASGNVGINTTTMAERFNVAGGIKISASSAATNFFTMSDSASGGHLWIISPGAGTGGTSLNWYDGSVGAVRIALDTSGNFGVGTASPNTLLDVNGSVATRKGTVALSNGLNSNISKPAFATFRITGPTGAFSVGGLTGGADGVHARIYNTTAQTMTIVNEDASSTAANRIKTLTGANIVLRASATSFCSLEYDATDSRWIVTGTN